MPTQKKSFFGSCRIMLLGAPFFLIACHSDLGPYPMPSGYTYHDQVHQSPDGSEPVWKLITRKSDSGSKKENCTDPKMKKAHPQMTVMPGDEVVWNQAAGDLVTRLVDGFGQPVEPVYIGVSEDDSPSEIYLAKALQTVMQQKGFTLAPAPGMGPYTLDYSVAPISVGEGDRVIASVTLSGASGSVAEESGIYMLDVAPPVYRDVPEPHVSSGPSVSSGEPIPILPVE